MAELGVGIYQGINVRIYSFSFAVVALLLASTAFAEALPSQSTSSKSKNHGKSIKRKAKRQSRYYLVPPPPPDVPMSFSAGYPGYEANQPDAPANPRSKHIYTSPGYEDPPPAEVRKGVTYWRS